MKNRLALFESLTPGSFVAELGVAEGHFAAKIIASGVAGYTGVDLWAGDRRHDDAQYERATRRITEACDKSTSFSRVLRRSFAEAARVLRPEKFDLVYIDGYAHTGQENGATLHDWWERVWSGGILAGHDYHPKWQPTIDAVNKFAADKGLELHLTGETEQGMFPSWYFHKP